MEVDGAPPPVADPRLRQDGEEAREHHQFYAPGLELAGELLFPRAGQLAVGGEHEGGQSMSAGALDGRSVRAVGDDQRHLGREVPSRDQVREPLEGGALAGDQHADREDARHVRARARWL